VSRQPEVIVGAGLAGLLAAHAWPQLPVLEADNAPRNAHNALLRFRTDAVSKLTGIEFRKVRVHKGMWYGGGFREPTIRHANQYAQKVTGRLSGDRSVWNLNTAERFIAPTNFYEQLIVAATPRIQWGARFAFDKPCVSTAPLPVVLKAARISALPGDGLRPLPQFERAPIRVRRYLVPGADVFQTVYFPNPATAMYRASITGSLLIVESIVSPEYQDSPVDDLDAVMMAFGLRRTPDTIDDVEQHYGKIVGLDAADRNALLWQLTAELGVYSLGRFATWRNILLDDVVDDIAVIKRLSRAAPHKIALHATR